MRVSKYICKSETDARGPRGFPCRCSAVVKLPMRMHSSYREHLLEVQGARKGMWATIEVPKAPAASAAAAVAGRVIEVVSGDTLVVRLADNREVRLSLARFAAALSARQAVDSVECVDDSAHSNVA